MKDKRFKYPRTPHLPWSPGATSDDLRVIDTSHFEGKEVVVTEKMDGENTTLYRDGLHARSIDSVHHPSRAWIKSFHAGIRNDISEGVRYCGENLFARHALSYDTLPSYFLLFSIWSDEQCDGWNSTTACACHLGLHTTPVLYQGIWNEEHIRGLREPGKPVRSAYGPEAEGYVVRLVSSFAANEFSKSIAKWVRPGHVGEDSEHWMHRPMVPNQLA